MAPSNRPRSTLPDSGYRFPPPRMVYDLPAGAPRLVQFSRGYKATIVSGEVVREDGEFTGARPGVLIRGRR